MEIILAISSHHLLIEFTIWFKRPERVPWMMASSLFVAYVGHTIPLTL